MNHYSYNSRRVTSGARSMYSESNYGDPPPMPTSQVLNMNAQKQYDRDVPRYNSLNPAHPRNSSLLNIQDPVAMHLLMETAMADSGDYEVLSFEEVEDLKKEHNFLSNRIEAMKRKFALESKLRDAAQSLNRLYSARDGKGGPEMGPDGIPRSPTKGRRSLLGRRSASGNTILETTLEKTDDEYAASMRKCEDLSQEIWQLEQRDQELMRKILEHTAGILQMTHKGLKKNIRRDELPRSPESMASYNHQSVPRFDGVDDFDDRSLYRTTDFGEEPGMGSIAKGFGGAQPDLSAVEDAEKRLELVTGKLQHMMQQLDSGLSVEEPVLSLASGMPRIGHQLPARVQHLERSLDAISQAQTRTVESSQRTIVDSEGQLSEINSRLYDLLTLSNNGQTPVVGPPNPATRNLRSQLSFVGLALSQLGKRVEHFVEQKTILTTQIQQQRELNTKSDAQRDAQITDLTDQLAQSKKALTVSEQEAHTVHEQIELLMEQLDEARQQVNLREQQRFMDESKALQAERTVNSQSVQRLESDLEAKQQQFTEAQGMLSEARNELEIREQQHEQQLREVTAAKEQAEIEATRCQEELGALEGEVVRAQTELTIVRAELDGAYGTRAQRAADVKANPLVQREIDELNDKNASLLRQIEYMRDEAEKAEFAFDEKHGGLIDELDALRDQHEQEMGGLNSHNKSLKDELESIRNRDEAQVGLNDQHGSLIEELEDLRSRHQQTQLDLTERNTNLMQDFNALRMQHEKTKKDLDDKSTSLIQEIEYLRANPPSGPADGNDLQSKVTLLQQELQDTIDDYELMTKASIQFERERDQLELLIDGLRERCDNLEGQLSDERVRWLGMKSPNAVTRDGAPSELTSVMVLKNEFKKMMRDTRSENMKALKAEQEERRRLESLVRNLRKEQQQHSPHKSNLSQSNSMQ